MRLSYPTSKELGVLAVHSQVLESSSVATGSVHSIVPSSFRHSGEQSPGKRRPKTSGRTMHQSSLGEGRQMV